MGSATPHSCARRSPRPTFTRCTCSARRLACATPSSKAARASPRWRSKRSDPTRTLELMPLPPVLRNLPLPIFGAPLFIVSNPKLLLEQCKAGVIGSMPALNARPAEQLDEWLAEITEGLAAHDKAHPQRKAAPFAINQIVHRSNDRLDHDMAVCAKYRVPIV